MGDKKEIIWSAKSKSTYRTVIHYLLNNWSEKEIRKFVDETSKILNTLSSGVVVYKRSLKKSHFEILITKHNLLIYKIQGRKIILVTFYDTRQHPLKKKI